MKLVKVTADLSEVKDISDFYKKMTDLFQFPEFFGKNIHDLIDCLFSLRYLESRMTRFYISDSECLLLEVFGFSSLPDDVAKILTDSVELVNIKCNFENQLPSIVLLLNEHPFGIHAKPVKINSRIYVDFDNDQPYSSKIVGLSKTDEARDFDGNVVTLCEGDYIYLFMPIDEVLPEYFFSEGVVIKNPYEEKPYKWCCRLRVPVEYMDDYEKVHSRWKKKGGD